MAARQRGTVLDSTDAGDDMGPTGNSVNLIQSHPTLRCNLRCKHCYSSSGTEEAGELPVAALEEFLAEVGEEGFNAVGISGGEPLTHRPLPRLLASARRLGLYASVTTNGLLAARSPRLRGDRSERRVSLCWRDIAASRERD